MKIVKNKLFIILFLYTISNIYSQNDYVYTVINDLDIHSYEILKEEKYNDNNIYTVYRINDNLIITVSKDDSEQLYLIGNATSNEAMLEIIEYLTSIYTEAVPYLDGEGYVAYFNDIENKYIKDNFPDYIGTFTAYGNQLFVEEVITQEKIIIQRQWCTPDFYEAAVIENGQDWGFIASWEEIEIVFDEPEQDLPSNVLPAQYTVRSWKETGDSFSAIAKMPFIYGDAKYWRILYDANKSKLPKQNNPHLIYPGTILDIPSLNDEFRSGMWNPIDLDN